MCTPPPHLPTLPYIQDLANPENTVEHAANLDEYKTHNGLYANIGRTIRPGMMSRGGRLTYSQEPVYGDPRKILKYLAQYLLVNGTIVLV